MDRWRDYQAGKLTPPCVVQHDEVNSEHLIWVWTGTHIEGPVSRLAYDEFAVVKDVMARAESVETVAPDAEVVTLRSLVVALEAEAKVASVEKAALVADKAALTAEVAALKKGGK